MKAKSPTLDLLQVSLLAAVPLHIQAMQHWTFEERQEVAQRAGEYIAGPGAENLLFRSRQKGDSAKAFNLLAKALAAMSYFPGGVRAFGLHFDALHPFPHSVDKSEDVDDGMEEELP